MHANPVFRSAPESANIAFARDRGFGTLSVNGDPAPCLAHVPFLLNGAGSVADLHLVRSNPMVKLLKQPQPAVISILGPDSYISPDWYGAPDQVPTWNYVAVHLRGTLSLLPEAELSGILDRLSESFETRLAPKPVWKSDKLPPALLQKQLRMIVPVRLLVDDIQGTWKLAQNKTDAARSAAAAAVSRFGLGSETSELARLMQGPPKR